MARGTEQVELGYGYVDQSGVRHTQATVEEMTGEAEEALTTAEADANPAKALTKVLAIIVKGLGNQDFVSREMVRRLVIGDREHLFLVARKLSFGDKLVVSGMCPACRQQVKKGISVDEVRIRKWSGQDPIIGRLPNGVEYDGGVHTDIELRYPNGADQETVGPVMRHEPARGVSLLYRDIIQKVGIVPKEKITEEMILKMTIRDRTYIQDLIEENMPGPELNVEIICPHCGEYFKVLLAFRDFFRSRGQSRPDND